MNNRQELNKIKQEYLTMNVPKEGLERMKQRIKMAKVEKRRIIRITWIRNISVAAAVLSIAVILPNVNANMAYAMGKIPVLGEFFKVVTFRDYQYEDDYKEADVKIPQVTLGEQSSENTQKLQDSAEKINVDIQKITQELIQQFQDTLAEEGHMGLEIDHEIVSDNEKWFTLRLTVLETQASGYQYYKYYTVDKQSGEMISLADLFKTGSDYRNLISEEIKKQMREQMAQDEEVVYFLDSEMPIDEFQQIKEEQNFYFNAEGNLVIVFDEYEVAPGYMGTQEFIIGDEVIGQIRKN